MELSLQDTIVLKGVSIRMTTGSFMLLAKALANNPALLKGYKILKPAKYELPLMGTSKVIGDKPFAF